MPFYDEDDDEPTSVPAAPLDFSALIEEVTPETVADAFFQIVDGVIPGQTLIRGIAEPGRGVSQCHTCHNERWYGPGPCTSEICQPKEIVPPPPTSLADISIPPADLQHRMETGAWPAPAVSRWAEQPRLVPAATPDIVAPAVQPPPEEDDTEIAFAVAVAEALERISPNSGTALASHQIPPPEHADPDSEVTGWVMLAGRNAGKTYAGARWLNEFMSARPKLRARIIAPSFGDAVASCIEGPSGILAASNYQVQWQPAHAGGAQLVWPNGSVCYVIGTPTPRDVDRLRAIGNVDADWYEEAAANPQIVEAERQARLSRRRKGAKWIATTTPRPLKTIRDWKKDPAIRISAATAHDNKHADPLWLEELERMYAGTRLYAQEVLGHVLEDVEGALWKLEHLERSRVRDIAAFYEMLLETEQTITKAAVGVDPANSTGTTGIVAAVMTNLRHIYVVEDVSQQGLTSDQWARRAVDLARQWAAPIVPENDSGGDAIRGVLKAADLMDDVTIMPATARGRGGKSARAEPIALLWERDDFRGHIVGQMPQLEDQMTTYVEGITKESPDRMDACVWACTYLWTQASFNDVSAQFPNQAENTGNAANRRPGQAIRWHKGKRKTTHHGER